MRMLNKEDNTFLSKKPSQESQHVNVLISGFGIFVAVMDGCSVTESMCDNKQPFYDVFVPSVLCDAPRRSEVVLSSSPCIVSTCEVKRTHVILEPDLQVPNTVQ